MSREKRREDKWKRMERVEKSGKGWRRMQKVKEGFQKRYERVKK